MRKENYVWGVLATFILCFALAMGVASEGVFSDVTDNVQQLGYHSKVCLYKNGEPVGDCSHNVLYNTGAEMIENFVGDGSSGAVLNISLCNATAGCGEPVADASETYNEYDSCGLASSQGTKYSNGNGNWTVSKTFTASCDSLVSTVTRITNQSGTNFAGNNFTSVTLQTNDQLTVNWTIWVS